MAGYYLIAHGKADTAAAVLGAALVEALLNVRKLCGGDTVAVVADLDDDIAVVEPEICVHHAAVSAVLRGIVKQAGYRIRERCN